MTLNSQEKNQYAPKIRKTRETLNRLRVDFFKLEYKLNKEMGIEEKHTDEKDRHKLNHNHGMLTS